MQRVRKRDIARGFIVRGSFCGFRVSGKIMMWGFAFRVVYGVGFRVSRFAFRVSGFGKADAQNRGLREKYMLFGSQ